MGRRKLPPLTRQEFQDNLQDMIDKENSDDLRENWQQDHQGKQEIESEVDKKLYDQWKEKNN